MTPTTLEALARALARLEPSVFAVHHSDEYIYKLFVRSKNVAYVEILSDTSGVFDDDRLFSEVLRCALRHPMSVSIVCPIIQPGYVHCQGWYDHKEPVSILNGQVGVALALAYCAACGEKVDL